MRFVRCILGAAFSVQVLLSEEDAPEKCVQHCLKGVCTRSPFSQISKWRLRKGASGRRSGRREKAGAHKLCPILLLFP